MVLRSRRGEDHALSEAQTHPYCSHDFFQGTGPEKEEVMEQKNPPSELPLWINRPLALCAIPALAAVMAAAF
jgi:hypothetical protein